MNVDQSEIAKFSALAHRWWDQNSEFKPLHAINPLRLGWIKSFVDLNGKRALDVGCGGGLALVRANVAVALDLDGGVGHRGRLGPVGLVAGRILVEFCISQTLPKILKELFLY